MAMFSLVNMADSRSQLGFGQIGPQGQAQPGGYTQGQLNMMQQQHLAMMQQQQQHMAQQGGQMMMAQQPMMQHVGAGMPQAVMGGQQFAQQQMYANQMQQQHQQMPMGMYMLQGGQYVTAGFPQAAIPGQNFIPPPYTPQMAQEYKVKSEKLAARQAKHLAEQQKRVEAEHKARMFQEQQKRLKEFSAIGGRKMDADSLIKHIIGPDTKHKPAGQPAPAQPVTAPAPSPDDDGFGDFIQGPSVTDFSQSAVSLQPAPQASSKPTVPSVAAQPVPSQPHSAKPESLAAQTRTPPPSHTPPITHTPPMAQTPPTAHTPPMSHAAVTAPPQGKEEKKDLEKMMFASCDLTAPQKARTFHKRTLVKDAPKQVRSAIYQPSQKARLWGGETETLSDLFTMPAPEPPQSQPQPATQLPELEGQPGQGQPAQVQGQIPAGQGSQGQPGAVHPLPAWCMGETPLPDIYTMVLQASTREGRIQTDLVYAILVRSGLPREVLGAIWGMANKTMPGQLLPHELCAVLALIAVAQNSMALPSIDILHRLPGPPIPNLGQGAPAAEPNAAAAVPQPAGPQQPPPPQGGATDQPAGVPGGGAANADDEFADFQEFQDARCSVQPSDSFGDFTAASPVNPATNLPGSQNGGLPTAGNTAPTTAPETLLGEADKYSVFKRIDHDAAPAGPDLFAASDTSKSGLPSLQPPGPTSAAPLAPTQPDVATFMGQPVKQEFADFESASANQGFADFPQVPLSGSGGGVSGSGGGVPGPASGVSGGGGVSGPAEKSSSSLGVSGGSDKLSVLKALVSDNKLYNSEKSEKLKAEGTEPEEEDWAEFSSIREPGSKDTTAAPAVDKYASLSTATEKGPSLFDSSNTGSVFGVKPVKETKQKELFPADDETEEWGGFAESDASTNWADFGSPPVSLTDPSIKSSDGGWSNSKPADWALNSSKKESDLTNFGTLSAPKAPEPTKPKDSEPPAKPYSTTSKKFNYFARNLDAMANGGGANVGTGMSPLDFQPPELPDVKDEEEEDFDKFGTFHGVDPDVTTTSSTGISSLGAPFGGMDDVGLGSATIDMFGYTSRPRTHAQPQKDTADSVSISSNEFTGWKVPGSKSAKESDTQSVSSLDFNTSKAAKSSKDGSPAGGDSQSVSSLEFGAVDRKSVTPADERSIASLELKVVSTPEDAPVDAPRPPTEEDGFGEFSSATDAPKNGFKSNMSNMEYVQRPRAASDLLRRGDLPSIVDRYSSLAEKQEDGERHVSEWERCLDKCRGMLEQAAHSFTSISDPALCEEVLHSRQGTQYIQGIVEIYRVACRITEAMKAVSISNEKLVALLKAIDTAWLDLVTLLSDTLLKPSPGRLDFSGAVLKTEDETAQDRACGVCLLNVDARGARGTGADHKLTYGGRQYHAACANFWVNCVDSMLPALKIPELL